MKNKSERLLTIRKIISENDISSQESLLTALSEKGFELTQATLSRDLKELRVAKVSDREKGYVYVIPERAVPVDTIPRIGRGNFLADGFKGIQFSNNLAVVKTLPGYANSIAATIDKGNPWEIIGTIAGDDTILLVIREGVARREVINSLILVMPNLKEKIG